MPQEGQPQREVTMDDLNRQIAHARFSLQQMKDEADKARSRLIEMDQQMARMNKFMVEMHQYMARMGNQRSFVQRTLDEIGRAMAKMELAEAFQEEPRSHRMMEEARTFGKNPWQGPVAANPWGDASPATVEGGPNNNRSLTPPPPGFSAADQVPSPTSALFLYRDPKGKMTLSTPRNVLISFYTNHNERFQSELLDVKAVDKLLLQYAGQEAVLFQKLVEKYKVDPAVFGLGADGHPIVAAPEGSATPIIQGTPTVESLVAVCASCLTGAHAQYAAWLRKDMDVVTPGDLAEAVETCLDDLAAGDGTVGIKSACLYTFKQRVLGTVKASGAASPTAVLEGGGAKGAASKPLLPDL
ncbi:hypothetical protein ACHAXT_004210 [Thalassiosira profunda]